MVRPTAKPIRITSASDLDRLLEDARDAPVLLEHEGIVYRLSREDISSPTEYEPDAGLVHRTLDSVSGSWAGADVDEMIEDVYQARRAGSRSPDRP